MTRLLRAGVLVLTIAWWAPTIALGLVWLAAYDINTRRIVRRARRLRLAGRLDEAAAVLERAQGRIPGDRRPGDAP